MHENIHKAPIYSSKSALISNKYLIDFRLKIYIFIFSSMNRMKKGSLFSVGILGRKTTFIFDVCSDSGAEL